MQIVFSHYHLNAAGVTQVILNQLRSLAKLDGAGRPERVGVLFGGRRDGWPDVLWNPLDGNKIETVLMPLPSLDYLQLPNPDEHELAWQTVEILRENGFLPSDTVLHLHNHSLGKNVSWPGAVAKLAEQGFRLLLQVHDFVEDFRPTNYRHLATTWQTDDPAVVAAKQYPTGQGIHYATLSSRDESLLQLAGVDQKSLHLLPNPVAEFHGLPERDSVDQAVRDALGIPSDSRLVIYPVRGIRRKNVGELLLHAAVSDESTWHAITLAPKNPVEQPSFERWRSLAQSLNLRCLFDICGSRTVDFLNTMSAADALITTSVAEGFGMVYLEAWLAGKALLGRDLPDITRDFKQSGLNLDHLYSCLPVPLSMLGDREQLVESFLLAYEWACEGYSVPPANRNTVREQIDALMADDTIDFALLPSRLQEQVIRQAAADPESLRDVVRSSTLDCDTSVIEKNAKLARKSYSLSVTADRLAKTYAALANDATPKNVVPAAKGAKILEQFLRVDRLHAIRFEE